MNILTKFENCKVNDTCPICGGSKVDTLSIKNNVYCCSSCGHHGKIYYDEDALSQEYFAFDMTLSQKMELKNNG